MDFNGQVIPEDIVAMSNVESDNKSKISSLYVETCEARNHDNEIWVYTFTANREPGGYVNLGMHKKNRTSGSRRNSRR